MTAPPNDKTMTFWEHLEELRRRIIRSAVVFALASGIAWVFREQLLLTITDPFIAAWRAGALPGEPSLHFATPAALFMTYITLSLIGGLVLALPWVLYEVWAFVAPGLYAHEKRYALPFVLASSLLFATGGWFGYRFAFPQAFAFLLADSGAVAGSTFQVVPTVMIGDYITFVGQMLIAFGLVFELPVLTFFLAVAGIVNHRHLIRYFRHFVVVAFVIGAVLTPPDPASQFVLAAPLIVLYGVSIGVAWLFGRPRRQPEAPAEAPAPPRRPRARRRRDEPRGRDSPRRHPAG